MDTFFKTEYLTIFNYWIAIQLKKQSIPYTYQNNTYTITYQNKTATITLYPIGIIEQIITQNQQTLFYLHYELKHLHLAINYFNQFINQLLIQTNQKQLNILLCCSGGMTTSYFADKLNDYIHLNQLPIHVDATAFYHIEHVINHYDMVFIAPQLKYKVISLTQQYPHIHIESIDPIIFASYNCNQFIKHIEEVSQ